MAPLNPLIEWTTLCYDESWEQKTKQVLTDLLESGPWGAAAAKHVQIRVNAQSPEKGIPYAALIPKGQPDSGPYGGSSFVLFPSRNGPPLFGLVGGTQGLQPDEAILSRPGHARSTAAISLFLNRNAGKVVAWAKRDPVRIDQDVPATTRTILAPDDDLHSALDRYGKHLYLGCRLQADDEAALRQFAVSAILEFSLRERGVAPLKKHQTHFDGVRQKWRGLTITGITEEDLTDLLGVRRFVILEGPPGTGKTRLACNLISNQYGGRGLTIQFHPSVTYEDFVGGLAPTGAGVGGSLQFEPKAGHLMRACLKAQELPDQPFLLHIDEINRADLAKTLGEAIFLFEPGHPEREVELAYDFGGDIGSRLKLPENLHVLGTMNNADRNISIVDLAIRRRFAFQRVFPDAEVVRKNAGERCQRAFNDLFELFLNSASDDMFDLMPGHGYFMAVDDGAAKKMLRTGVAPLLRDYLRNGFLQGFEDDVQAYIDGIEADV